MKAVLFGSIGTLIGTSDIQRKSFNLAFKKYFLIALLFLLMSGMCEDDAIEVEVADNFVNTFHITDKGSFSEFFQTGEVDLGDLIEKHGDVLKSLSLIHI